MGKHDRLIGRLKGWISSNKEDVAELESGHAETFDCFDDGRPRLNTTKLTIAKKTSKIAENEVLLHKCELDRDPF